MKTDKEIKKEVLEEIHRKVWTFEGEAEKIIDFAIQKTRADLLAEIERITPTNDEAFSMKMLILQKLKVIPHEN